MSNDLHIDVSVEDIGIGMMVDLANDPYADPEDREHIFPYEYAVVEEWEIETADCIRIDFHNTSIGFPRDHKLTVAVEIPQPSC